MKTIQTIKQDNDKTISLVEHETTHAKYIQKKGSSSINVGRFI